MFIRSLRRYLSTSSIWKVTSNENCGINSSICSSNLFDGVSPFYDLIHKTETKVINDKMDNEYIPMQGTDSFNNSSLQLVFGKNILPSIQDQIATVQCLSSVGGLNFALKMLKEELGDGIQIATPNYRMNTLQLQIESLKLNNQFTFKALTDKKSPTMINKLINEIKFIPKSSVIIINTGANHPMTYLKASDWEEISNIFEKKELQIVINQISEGIQLIESTPAKIFTKNNIPFFLINSLEDTFGIKNNPVATLSYFAQDPEIKERVLSNLKIKYVRYCYSSPPIHGARIADLIFNNPELYQEWKQVLTIANEKADTNRKELGKILEKINPQKYAFITAQLGKYCNIFANEKEALTLKKEFGNLVDFDGILNLSEFNTSDIQKVAEAILKL